MLVERKTVEGIEGKVYLVLLDGKVLKTFPECEGITAMADANEFIEDHLITLTAAGHVAQVKYN
jgi:hypothetical protein